MLARLPAMFAYLLAMFECLPEMFDFLRSMLDCLRLMLTPLLSMFACLRLMPAPLRSVLECLPVMFTPLRTMFACLRTLFARHPEYCRSPFKYRSPPFFYSKNLQILLIVCANSFSAPANKPIRSRRLSGYKHRF